MPPASLGPHSPEGPSRPRLLVFDVNETLSDMAPLSARFEDVGAPAHLAKLWFAELLRDGFAVTVAGGLRPFAALGAEALRVRLHGQQLDRPLEDAVDHVMQGFSELAVHPDVVEGVRALGDLGIRLVTLSNGSAGVADTLLQGAGVRDRFERVLTVEDAGAWKPAPGRTPMRWRSAASSRRTRCSSRCTRGTSMARAVPGWPPPGSTGRPVTTRRTSPHRASSQPRWWSSPTR